MGCAHTTFAKGKTILVVMRNGSSFKCKFSDSTSKQIIVLKNEEKMYIDRKDLKSCTIWKGER